jgi:hypothetical protein
MLSLGLKDTARQEAPGWLQTTRALGHRSVRLATRQRSSGAVHTPPAPPPCPPGWRAAAPDFIGVGAQRCGTTRWFDLIACHPQVMRPMITKELHYFDRFFAADFTAADASAYREHFPRDGDRKSGEWTPSYLCSPWIPALLAASAPEARVLVLLRDPVERYISGLVHETAIARENGAPLSELAPLQAFARGLYGAQLARLLDHFERSQLLILQFERCTREPAAELRRTFEFLGVDSAFLPELDTHPHRQPDKPTLPAATRQAYVEAYQDDVSMLTERFSEIDLALWPNFAQLAQGELKPGAPSRRLATI